MNEDYGRNLDLNLLRVLAVVAEAGSVTAAADRLYLTQPAISAALRRLNEAVGERVFARQGRGLVLTTRGERLLAEVRPHLKALVDAALSPPGFDPKTSERCLRIGLADAIEVWLLPALLRVFAVEAPRMSLVVVPVQFRTVESALFERKIEVAVTVADALPASIRRKTLFAGGFVCLYDPRHARLGAALTEREYLAREHVIVSYNGDLRGVVEDLYGLERKVRCSVPSFNSIGAIVDGTPLLATVPEIVARQIRATRAHLKTAKLPFKVQKTPKEMLWSSAVEADAAVTFLRRAIERIVKEVRKEP